MNYQPKTYLKAVSYIAPKAWEQYLTKGKGISQTQKVHCDAFLTKIEREHGEVHFVISGEAHPNVKIRHAGCMPSRGQTYTLLIKHGAMI